MRKRDSAAGKGAPVLGLLLSVYLANCGVEVGNPKNPTGDDSTSTKAAVSIIAQDSGAATQVIGDNLDETIQSVSENNSSSSAASLALAGGDGLNLNGGSLSATCAVDEKKAVVTVTRSGSFSRNRILPPLTVNSAANNTRTATWSRPDGTGVLCNNNNTRAHINFPSLDKVDLAVTFKREITQSVVNRRTSATLQEKYFKAEGTRNLSWVKNRDENGERIHSLTISKSIDREVRFTTIRSGEQTLKSSIKTQDGSPLKIESRFKSAGSWSKKTIQTGTVVSTLTDGARIENTYVDVVFDPSSGCRPVSGFIDGKLIDAGSDDVRRAFKVTFSDSGTTVTFTDGEVTTYQVGSCDFED